MLKDELIKKERELELLIQKLDDDLKGTPEGKLRIAKTRKYIQYFHITDSSDRKGNYIKAKDHALALALAQKDYAGKLRREAEKQLNAIRKTLAMYSDDALQKVYSGMNSYRKEMIHPYVLSDEEFVRAWLEKQYEPKGFSEFEQEYYTIKKERVRSKSEILIANALYEHGIPYKYECPVYMKGFGNIYPDFTILLLPSRKEVYLEHFGMMDKERYQDDFFRKISTYTRNGIVQGENLIMLFESSKYPLNTRDLDLFLDEISGK